MDDNMPGWATFVNGVRVPSKGSSLTLGARVPGVTAVGMTHLDGVGVVHVVIGVPTIVQSGPTQASRLWRESERPALEREGTRECERERETHYGHDSML